MPEASPGQTLVRMLASQVAHLDLNVVDGKFGILPDLPAVPGTNGCGVV
ncbi:alcohol dehydrogenase catalytic domain-containing protein [Streptomyces indonesiensis]